MDPADLHRLTDVDFEALTHDLFQELLGTPLELFAPGPDSGVDLRYLSPDGHRVVIQCKHWWRSGAAALVRHIRNVERSKVESLNPDRYILVTSADLSVDARDRLLVALSPWVSSPTDIVGAREIASYLEQRPAVVRRHLRLWLSSAAILGTVLHQNIHVRSEALVADASETLSVWVENPSRNRAQELLEREHVAVIAGLPGIGKTALAQVLCAIYGSQGYEIIDVGSDIDEANAVWVSDAPQLFFYDDFLGQTTIAEKLGKNEDGRLVAFMRRAHASQSKRLVLTTREYILEDSRRRYEKLARQDFDPMTCVIDLADYTRRVRAQMLYNHLYFSALDDAALSAFARPDGYLAIVDHPNFNPRLVTRSIRYVEESGETGSAAIARVTHALDEPTSLWNHIVREQLDHVARQLLCLLAVLPPTVELEDLISCLREVVQGLERDTLLRAVRTLDGTMVSTRRDFDGRIAVSFHNPSIRDYMISFLEQDDDQVRRMVDTTQRFEIVESIWRASEDRPSGSSLRDWLRTEHVVVADALLRTLDAPPLRYGWGITYAGALPRRARAESRLPSAVELAEIVDQPAVYDGIVAAFGAARMGADEDAAALARRTSNSPNEQLAAAGRSLIDHLAGEVTERLKYADDVANAVEVANRIGDEFPLDARQRVAEAAAQLISDAADRYFESVDDDLDRLIYQLEDGRWDIDQDALGSIESQFGELRSSSITRSVKPEPAPTSSPDDDRHIGEIFQLLRRS